jgi:hypothetical protein
MAYSAVAAPRSEISVDCEVNVLVIKSGCQLPEFPELLQVNLLKGRGPGLLCVAAVRLV